MRRASFWIMLLAICLPAPAARGQHPPEPVEPERVYQPAGALANPKVPAQWNRFHDYAQASELLKKLAAAHPAHCRLQSLGQSHGKREMWVMTITNFEVGKEDEKPAFWIDGGIHANEIQAVDVVLYTAWYLAEMNGRSPMITRLLNDRVFYLAPMMSPDSRDAHMYRPNTTHSPRGGQMPVDDDRDGLVNEDAPDDLDGDGSITQMRIRDPNGKHKPHPEFPNLLVRVGPGEQGQYTLLGQEGIDNDDDGRVNEDGDGYYDPNRDWAWNWQPRSVQRGAHHYPFSILENRMVADFIMDHPNIAGAQSYHNTGGMILRGPGAKNDRVEGSDKAVYDLIAKRGVEMLPNYRYLETASGLYEAHGITIDWLYGMQGVLAFTNELNTPANMFRAATGGGFFGSPETLYKFNKYLLLGDGIVEWKPYRHPQFGKVEIGGLKKNWVRQPPSFLLEEECHRNMAFTLFHADQMPQVQVQSVEVEPIDGGLIQVTAVIVNRKLIPTRTARDVQKKITPRDRITIDGENLQVIAAFTSDRIVFDKATEHRRRPAEIRPDTLASLRPLYVRWIVNGQGPYTITVRSVKGGIHQRTSGKEPGP